MMHLQPLTGAIPETTPVLPAASGAAGAFGEALATSVARQDVPGAGRTILPGGTPASAVAARSGQRNASVANAPAAADAEASAKPQTEKDGALLSPSHAIPVPVQIGASIAVGAVMGNPIGVVETVFMGLVGELARMGPDLSRPAMPAGMSQTHTKAGIQPVSPGTLGKGEYLTLATTTPAFLANGSFPQPAMVSSDASAAGAEDGSSVPPAAPMIGLMAHYAGMNAYQRRQALEKGLY